MIPTTTPTETREEIAEKVHNIMDLLRAYPDEFINYHCEKILDRLDLLAKVNMEYICGPNPVKPGIDALDDDYRSLIMLTPEQLKRGQLLRSFDGKPAVMALYNKAWDRIKATEAK